jgi:acyl-CoA thioesterase-1
MRAERQKPTAPISDTHPLQRRTLLALGLAGSLVVGCGKSTKFVAIPPGATVLAFGDSVTFGVGAATGEDWPSLLASKTGWNVVNAGISGDTAENGKTRIQGLLTEHRPALVVVEIGGNDFLRRKPPVRVKEDVHEIIKAIRSFGAQAALVSVPELSVLGVLANRPSDSPIFEELAKEEGVALVPDVFSETLARPELCADKIHPNALGYQFMASGIHARLQKVGLAA